MKKRLQHMFDHAYRYNTKNTVALLEPNRNANFLDLGCENGSLTQVLANRLGTTTIVGVEITPADAEAAAQRGLLVKQFDLNKRFNFDDSSFDVIHANQVIEHLFDADNFLAEIHRVLKPGGYTVISTENASSWCNIFASLMGWQIFSLTNMSMLGSLGNPWSLHRKTINRPASWIHVRIYNFRGLKELIEAHGFEVEDIRGAGYFPLPASLGNMDKIHAHFMTFKARKK